MDELVHIITANAEVLRSFEDGKVCELFRDYVKDARFADTIRLRKSKLGQLFNKTATGMFEFSDPEKAALREEGIDPDLSRRKYCSH